MTENEYYVRGITENEYYVPGITPAFQINNKSGVSREERQHLLGGKAQASKEEKVTSIYSERAQLLSSNSLMQRSWIE